MSEEDLHKPDERVDKPHEVVIIGGGGALGGGRHGVGDDAHDASGLRSGEIDEPGFYALRYPPMTAIGFLMLHLVFGVIVGVLYGEWAG